MLEQTTESSGAGHVVGTLRISHKGKLKCRLSRFHVPSPSHSSQAALQCRFFMSVLHLHGEEGSRDDPILMLLLKNQSPFPEHILFSSLA